MEDLELGRLGDLAPLMSLRCFKTLSFTFELHVPKPYGSPGVCLHKRTPYKAVCTRGREQQHINHRRCPRLQLRLLPKHTGAVFITNTVTVTVAARTPSNRCTLLLCRLKIGGFFFFANSQNETAKKPQTQAVSFGSE